MDILLIIGGVVLLVVLGVILYKVLKTTTQKVPQEERLVIYRLGRFHRIVGPGLVQVIPGLDEVIKSVEVRDHPVEVEVPGIMAFGVLNHLTLNLWCRVDLEEAAGNDKEKLSRLVQVSEPERKRQVQVKMREAITNQLALLEREMPLMDADTIGRIMAFAPGSERYNALRKGVQRELAQTLPSIGVILNTSQPIVLTGRDIPKKIIEALERGQGRDIDSRSLTKYAHQLREQFPDVVSDAMLDQMLASIEGVESTGYQRLQLEQDSSMASEVKYATGEDGVTTQKVVSKAKPRSQVTATQRPEEPVQPKELPIQLTEDDLAVLKRVPRKSSEQRLSA